MLSCGSGMSSLNQSNRNHYAVRPLHAYLQERDDLAVCVRGREVNAQDLHAVETLLAAKAAAPTVSVVSYTDARLGRRTSTYS
jgi:hypothetical protein